MVDCTTITFNSDFGNYGKLDLYSTASATTSTPLMVFIHGGAWRTEDKKDHEQLALNFVKQGFTVAVTNYRLSLYDTPDEPPRVQHPAHIQDTYQALTCLHQINSPLYDKNSIFLVGHSAGAHIATMLLLEPETYPLPFVRGVIGAAGIYDLPLLLTTHPTYLDFISQAFGKQQQESYYQASPTSKSHPSSVSAPPVLLVHSMDDQLLNLDQSQAMYHHLKKQGIDVTLDSTFVKGDHYAMIQSTDFSSITTQYINKIINKDHLI
ncbi:Alpha/Beta hydrolase protein [Chlamydoabsidia padenii]|nr:Alpha/Beta hydrolase protein [Chlamydoabsidia padenii]